MATSAEGIVEKAALFRGMVRVQDFPIVFVNDADEPIPALKCSVALDDGKAETFQTDENGTLIVPKPKGRIQLSLVREESEQPS